MMRYLITWKAVDARIPEDPKARVKQATSFTEATLGALRSGALKAWGCSPDGMKGYAVFEGTETAMALAGHAFVPFLEFDSYPVLTADEFAEVLKSV